MSKSASNIRNLQAAFEDRSRTPSSSRPPTFYRSSAGDLADMPTNKPPSRIASITKSIDSVLDTTAAKHPSLSRPIAKLRPSWIGPRKAERPATPGVEAMKQHVRIDFASPGLKPPVFIFTNLSDPQWEAVEMQSQEDGNEGYSFFQDFDAEEGEYQYKFRLGPGDWWVCDTTKPTIDDGTGNENNLFVVKPSSSSDSGKTVSERKDSGDTRTLQPPREDRKLSARSSSPDLRSATQPEQPAMKTLAGGPPAPLMKHETFESKLRSFEAGEADDATKAPETIPTKLIPDDEDESESHSLPGPKEDDSSQTENADSDTTTPDESDGDDDESEDEADASPLLRHESLRPSSKEQEQAPLLRHESMALGHALNDDASSQRSVQHPLVPNEANPNDQRLQTFPTDRKGILEEIKRTSAKLIEDDAPDVMVSSTAALSLPRIRESNEEEEKIRAAETEEYEREKGSGEELDPMFQERPDTTVILTLRSESPPNEDLNPRMTHEEADDVDVPRVPKIEMEKRIIIELRDDRKSFFDVLMASLGGKLNAIAIAVGLLTIAAGIVSLQLW